MHACAHLPTAVVVHATSQDTAAHRGPRDPHFSSLRTTVNTRGHCTTDSTRSRDTTGARTRGGAGAMGPIMSVRYCTPSGVTTRQKNDLPTSSRVRKCSCGAWAASAACRATQRCQGSAHTHTYTHTQGGDDDAAEGRTHLLNCHQHCSSGRVHRRLCRPRQTQTLAL
jgi:hypothetical protein